MVWRSLTSSLLSAERIVATSWFSNARGDAKVASSLYAGTPPFASFWVPLVGAQIEKEDPTGSV